ncbi:MAG: hypothetical protein R3C41_20465 [Calditrichia bacterium]
MKMIYCIMLAFLCSLPFYLVGCEQAPTGSSQNNSQDSSRVVVRKPNIYIYPENRIDITVSLFFPNGGEIIESIPEYKMGWEVSVDTNGVIDEQYGFLFYECQISNFFQRDSGWVVSRSEVDSFFKKNLYSYGFRGREIDDFIEFWVPKLDDSEHYVVYPQVDGFIDEYIQLNINPLPQTMIRLFYVIDNYNDKRVIHQPIIRQFSRNGFVVLEWGVIR